MWQAYKKDGLVVLSVSIADTAQRVKDFSAKYNLTYTQLIDGGAGVMGAYTTGIIPRTLVLDKEQKIVEMELGYTEEKFKRIITATEIALYGKAKTVTATATVKVDVSKFAYAVSKIETVDSEGNVGFFTSIDLDKNSNPIATYKNFGIGSLSAAIWDGKKWTIETVDDANHAGWSSSLAFSPATDMPSVSYGAGGRGGGFLRYAYKFRGKWRVREIDSNDSMISHTSLAYNSIGEPMISYYSKTGKDLKFARWDSDAGVWKIEVIDGASDVGLFSNLRIDKFDQPGIGYYDEVGQDVKFAHWNKETKSWKIEVVDAAGDVGQHLSVVFDAEGQALISYFDVTNSDLKLARWSNASKTWQLEIVDSEGTVGQRSSMELDSKGNPAISYFGNATLKFAWWNGTKWELMTADKDGDVGNYTSLALDSKDNARISYFDVSKTDFKMAWIDKK